MAQCGIMRVEKRKINSMTGLEAEANRTKKDEGRFPNSDVDWELTSQNIHLIKTDGWREEFKRQAEKTGVKTRSDSITMLDGLYTASSEFFEGKSHDQILKYFDQCLDFHIKHYCGGDDERLINAVIHLDEKTPHLQVASIPIIYDKEKDFYRLTAKTIMGNRKAYQDRQEAFYNEVTKQWGLERGEVTKDPVRAKKHLHKREWQLQEAEKQLKAINKNIEASKINSKAIESKISSLLKAYQNSMETRKAYGLKLGEPTFETPGFKIGGLRLLTNAQDKELRRAIQEKEISMHHEAGKMERLSTSIRESLKKLDEAYKSDLEALQAISEKALALDEYDKNIKEVEDLAKQKEELKKDVESLTFKVQEQAEELDKMARYSNYKAFAQANKEAFEEFTKEIHR